MRPLYKPHQPGHLKSGGPLRPADTDNRSRGGINKRRNRKAAANLAAVPAVVNPWAALLAVAKGARRR